MAHIKLYEIFEDGVSIGDFTSKEAADQLQIPRSAVINCANNGCMYKGRFNFELVDDLYIKPLLPVWEKVRREVLGSRV
jgi:hypothetical protein